MDKIKIILNHILIFIGTICTYLSVDEKEERAGAGRREHGKRRNKGADCTHRAQPRSLRTVFKLMNRKCLIKK